MLVHLLHGEFTVDREAIDYEAFTQGSKTYAYFGIFLAAASPRHTLYQYCAGRAGTPILSNGGNDFRGPAAANAADRPSELACGKSQTRIPRCDGGCDGAERPSTLHPQLGVDL